MTKRERAHFGAAKAISELSDHRVKIGCVVVNKHRIVSSGFNSGTKCNSLQAKLDRLRYGCDCPGHPNAELMALYPLIKSDVDLTAASIFVYRQTKDGRLACAKPCPSCEWLIRQCGIKKVYYTTKENMTMEKW